MTKNARISCVITEKTGPISPTSPPPGLRRRILTICCARICTRIMSVWNTRLLDGRWVPTFPNARYLFAREEWDHWQVAKLRARYTTDPYYGDSLLPVT